MSKHLKSCKTCNIMNMSLVLLCLTVTTLVCLLYKHVTLRKSKMAPNDKKPVLAIKMKSYMMNKWQLLKLKMIHISFLDMQKSQVFVGQISAHYWTDLLIYVICHLLGSKEESLLVVDPFGRKSNKYSSTHPQQPMF